MRNALKVAFGLALVMGAGACSDYLSGPGIDTDPNNVDKLTRPGALYFGIQAAQVVQREGQLARNAVQYVQQVSGNSRQSIGFDRYTTKPQDMDTYFGAVYGSTRTLTGGGGLLDVRKMNQIARKLNDSLYIGLGKVYEALIMGYAADLWGDVPYREAADSTNLTPHFDPQLQVYADVLVQLDSAINIYLPASSASNLGPGQDNAELIYKGREGDLPLLYTAVAHSLKARYYMHLAERDPSNYARALAEVGPPGLNNGGPSISNPNDDFQWYADGTPNGNNIWWQFSLTRADVAPGSALVNIIKRRITGGLEDDARAIFYFSCADCNGSPNDFFGFRPGGATNVQVAPGGDAGNGSPSGNYSFFGSFIDGSLITNSSGNFRQQELSWTEAQLIGAEATWHINCAGCDPNTVVPAAQPYLDAVRANRFYGTLDGARVQFPALGPAPASQVNIIEEKYISLFLNPEVWNDYKRTCLPALAPAVPAGSHAPGTAPIAARLPYGLTELNTNPNIPTSTNSVGTPITSTSRNPNDPAPCPVLNYVNSTPLAN
jgi:hypothetical protein